VNREASLALLLASALVVAGCGTSPLQPAGTGGQVVPEQARGTSDPFGDAFGTSGTNYDITRIAVERRTGEVWVTVHFVQNVLLPPPGMVPGGAELAGVVQLDTDQNSATGGANAVTRFCPNPSGVGPEFYVLLFGRLANGNYPVVDTGFNPTGEATPVLVRPNVLSLRIPLSAIGNDDGRADVDSVFGNGAEPTDCAPDNGGFVRPLGAKGSSGWGSWRR